MDNIQKLLNEIALISNKHEQIDQSTGRCFNIFSIANILETKTCRVIYELINPKGSHYQKGKYLKLFCENVLEIDVDDETADNASVFCEMSIDDKRRIDLFIKIADIEIPIEVKMGALDQGAQCVDYFKKAKGTDPKMFYLTLHTEEPSDDSRGDLIIRTDYNPNGEIVIISFEQHILDWIEMCLKDKETIKLAPLREIFLQFESYIMKFTGKMEEDKMSDILKTLTNSSLNMKSAVDIAKSVKEAKIYMIKKVFEEIENALPWKTVSDYNSYNTKNYNSCNTYYKTSQSTFPGINYCWKHTSKGNVDIWLRVEVNHRLYVGLFVATNGKNEGRHLDENEAKELLGELQPNGKDWQLYSEYLPNGGCDVNNVNSETPNFKNPDDNEAFYSLFDDGYRKEFIAKCVERIKKLMEKANAN